MQKLTYDNFNAETAKGFVLVDFYTRSCIMCKIIRPFLIKAEKELNSINVKVCEFDAEVGHEISFKYDVNMVPKVILFVDGEAVSSFVGVKSKKKIIEFVRNNI